MQTQGIFVFKGVKKKEGGEFTNTQGQKIVYPASYEVKFDEINENNECSERKVKISLEQKDLVEKLQSAKMYQKLVFVFDVGFNTKGITLKLIDVGAPKASEK